MKIAVPRETAAGERRVAIVPDSIRRLAAKGIEVSVEVGAGEGAFVADDDYRAVGARVDELRAILAEADGVVRIHAPAADTLEVLRPGTVHVSLLYPAQNPALVEAFATRGVTALAVDLIPRTTLAQSMDVLSSQATAAGYEAVLLAAAALPRFFPMLTTAAGTIAPAKVLVLGAGVAGLQAIATARRLGAVVEAFDVRKAVKEQVESLGAKFVEVEAEDAATAGGYAKELSAEAKKRQAEAIAQHVAKSDVVVCTALIPGRAPPVLVTGDMVRSMRPGSVVVDLALGNCDLTVPGQTTVAHGVTILGSSDLTSRMAVHASQMYSRNMEKLLLYVTREGKWKLDADDTIVRESVVTRDGAVVHPSLAPAASPAPAPSAGASA